MLSVVMLGVVMLNVVMLSVIAQDKHSSLFDRRRETFFYVVAADRITTASLSRIFVKPSPIPPTGSTPKTKIAGRPELDEEEEEAFRPQRARR